MNKKLVLTGLFVRETKFGHYPRYTVDNIILVVYAVGQDQGWFLKRKLVLSHCFDRFA